MMWMSRNTRVETMINLAQLLSSTSRVKCHLSPTWKYTKHAQRLNVPWDWVLQFTGWEQEKKAQFFEAEFWVCRETQYFQSILHYPEQLDVYDTLSFVGVLRVSSVKWVWSMRQKKIAELQAVFCGILTRVRNTFTHWGLFERSHGYFTNCCEVNWANCGAWQSHTPNLHNLLSQLWVKYLTYTAEQCVGLWI